MFQPAVNEVELPSNEFVVKVTPFGTVPTVGESEETVDEEDLDLGERKRSVAVVRTFTIRVKRFRPDSATATRRRKVGRLATDQSARPTRQRRRPVDSGEGQ
jgi:hypothetical protein